MAAAAAAAGTEVEVDAVLVVEDNSCDQAVDIAVGGS